jgi:hypothetical protein
MEWASVRWTLLFIVIAGVAIMALMQYLKNEG